MAQRQKCVLGTLGTSGHGGVVALAFVLRPHACQALLGRLHEIQAPHTSVRAVDGEGEPADLTDGLGRAAKNTRGAAQGARRLQTGAATLATGLQTAHDQVSIAVDGIDLIVQALNRDLLCTADPICRRSREGLAQIHRGLKNELLPGLQKAANGAARIARGQGRLAGGLDSLAAGLLGGRVEVSGAAGARLGCALPGEVFVARLAGDAFAVLGDAEVVDGPNIQACFGEPFVVEAVRHPVSVCAGIVRLAGDHRSGIEYLKDSYLALKRAKAQGLGQTVVYSRELGAEARERAQLLRDLRLAFDQARLFLVYQPQVDLATGRVVGVEALLRWARDDSTEISPSCFIPIAEQSGLIVGMGNWLLQIALLALQRFRAQGFPQLRMAVNVSPVQLRQPDFLAQVQEALAETGASAFDLSWRAWACVASACSPAWCCSVYSC